MSGRTLRKPFRNPSEGRPRAFWRILIPFLPVLGGVVAADLLLAYPLRDSLAGYAVGGASRIVIALGVLAVTARILDRRRLPDYGLRMDRGWWTDVAVGAGIGLLIFAISTGWALAAGWVRVLDAFSPAAFGGFWIVIALALFRLAAVSLWEELLFRGVMIKNGAEGLSGRWSGTGAVVVATAVSTVVFAVIHVPQNLGVGVPMWQMMAMWLALGVLLALGYVLTGQLALPLGLHLTVNLALQHLFVLRGEAAADSAAVLQLEVVGPDAVAGIAGLLHLVVIALGYVLLLGWVRWRYGALRIHPSLTRRPMPVTPQPAGDGVDDHTDVCVTAERR